MNKHLEIVEANLGREITHNFDKFSIAFENFDEIDDENCFKERTKTKTYRHFLCIYCNG